MRTGEAEQHELLLHSARDLSKTGWGRSDPYCRVLVNGVDVGRTPTRQRTQVRFLTGILDDFRRFVHEIWRF